MGVPEWHYKGDAYLEEGAEIWEVFNDGTEKLRAVYKKDINDELRFIKKN